MKSDYVKEYGRLEISHWWFQVRKKIILQSLGKYISQDGNKKILNVGAAGGATSLWLSAFGKVSSIENERLFLEHLRNNNIEVTEASAEQLPFADNSFDVVCAFDVVEHIDNDKNALKEMQRVCKPGGKICITVPAYQFLWGRHDVANGHKRRYTFTSLKQQLPADTVILYSTYFNTLLFLPVYFTRKIDWLIAGKKTATSDFESFKSNSILGAVCKFIFGLEIYLLKIMCLPFGVSLLVLLEKNAAAQKNNE
jgi:SAM-dependent methyltransferase